jgi:hypothetical protein
MISPLLSRGRPELLGLLDVNSGVRWAFVSVGGGCESMGKRKMGVSMRVGLPKVGSVVYDLSTHPPSTTVTPLMSSHEAPNNDACSEWGWGV